ncbi:MAG: amino acid ABC transporter ATP-binding protein [Alphaproteobacteria bacterium]|nr:amino acid ABC transporter ATP-binding protein [Alphaproteobacteria bacterium]
MQDAAGPHGSGSAPQAGAPHLAAMRGVSKSYGRLTVLDNIDMSVAPREKIAVIGASGSGKTTILRLLIGLDRPDSGTIEIDGRYLWHEMKDGKLEPAGERNARQVRRAVGMVFQQFNLFPHMTALENVREPIEQVLKLSRDEAEASAVDLLTQVGLDTHLRNRPAQLSGGQQQRVAIARALALRPKLMLFDEVTSALDPELVGEVLRVVRNLAHTNQMSMVVVTHEMTFAADIADRVLMFDQGKIIEEGPPSQVLKQPVNPRTRQFLRAVLER